MQIQFLRSRKECTVQVRQAFKTSNYLCVFLCCWIICR